LMKIQETRSLEETLNEYVKFLDMTSSELLVAIPDSDIGLYSNQKLKDAFEAGEKRGVKVRVLSNQKTRIGLPGHQYEAGLVLSNHYAVSDRKCVFMGVVGNFENGLFAYESLTFVPEHMAMFEHTPILTVVS